MVEPMIDWKSNCGNVSAAVGPFAIDEGLVEAVEPMTRVRIHQVNTGKVIIAEVPVKGKHAAVEGKHKIDGVPGTGAKIILDWRTAPGPLPGSFCPRAR